MGDDTTGKERGHQRSGRPLETAKHRYFGPKFPLDMTCSEFHSVFDRIIEASLGDDPDSAHIERVMLSPREFSVLATMQHRDFEGRLLDAIRRRGDVDFPERDVYMQVGTFQACKRRLHRGRPRRTFLEFDLDTETGEVRAMT